MIAADITMNYCVMHIFALSVSIHISFLSMTLPLFKNVDYFGDGLHLIMNISRANSEQQSAFLCRRRPFHNGHGLVLTVIHMYIMPAVHEGI